MQSAICLNPSWTLLEFSVEWLSEEVLLKSACYDVQSIGPPASHVQAPLKFSHWKTHWASFCQTHLSVRNSLLCAILHRPTPLSLIKHSNRRGQTTQDRRLKDQIHPPPTATCITEHSSNTLQWWNTHTHSRVLREPIKGVSGDYNNYKQFKNKFASVHAFLNSSLD